MGNIWNFKVSDFSDYSIVTTFLFKLLAYTGKKKAFVEHMILDYWDIERLSVFYCFKIRKIYSEFKIFLMVYV